jgi:hypothetical protein
MKRSSIIGLCSGIIVFAVTDLSFHALALWLGQNDSAAASAFVGQFLLPFFPIAIAGIAAGYLATPHGFAVGFSVGLAGAAVSLTWRYQGILEAVLQNRANLTSMVSWVAGTAILVGVCGLAGERVQSRSQRPNKSLERTRER